MSFDRPVQPVELPEEEREALILRLSAAFRGEASVRVAILFGSFARGQAFRDIDIGVLVDEPFRLLEVGRLAGRVWRAAGQPAVELDVVPLNDAPPSFRLSVAAEGRVLHERLEGEAADFEVTAKSEAIDFAEAWRLAGLELAG